MAAAPVAASSFDRDRHVKYWKRCHGAFLPAPYTANDSTRMTLACFIVSSLDLLDSPLSAHERAACRNWVLSLQHPDGGFCGGAAHGSVQRDRGTANLASTFFALILLTYAAESEDEQRRAFAGVDRRKLLSWLKKLQREDGGFGQLLWQGTPVGGNDVRHSYMAAGIRWMLRGNVARDDAAWVEDIDVDSLVAAIRQTQTLDGGMGESTAIHESHGGYTYCAVAALSLLGRPSDPSEPRSDGFLSAGVPRRHELLKFLSHRQFSYLTEDEEECEDDENFIQSQLDELNLNQEPQYVGMNGRWNKKADTCYYWWAAGALALLDESSMVCAAPARRYLLDVTQHAIGGFSKGAQGPPDIYHSYLGLTALSVMGEQKLKKLDPELCCSVETTSKIATARAGLLQAARAADMAAWENDGFWQAT